MNIALSPTLRRFVDEQVAEGRYLDAADVVREAVRRMEAQSRGSGWHLLGAVDGDIMQTALMVMMEAAKSAREDLKAIMDGVKAINKEKEGWRAVAATLNAFATIEISAIPRASRQTLQGRPVGAGTLDRNTLVLNIPDSAGATVVGGFVAEGTGGPGGTLIRQDIHTANETVKNKLDSLSEMGEMESLRLQMAMDRQSRMMSTLSNLLKKLSETAEAITQNLK